jgi:hypothetical protein
MPVRGRGKSRHLAMLDINESSAKNQAAAANLFTARSQGEHKHFAQPIAGEDRLTLLVPSTRGCLLGSLMFDRDDQVVCPGHLLPLPLREIAKEHWRA